MFPEETFHCVEFARDKFSKLFTLRPKRAIKLLEEKGFKPSNSEEIKVVLILINNVNKAIKRSGLIIEQKTEKL